jgi:DNA-binding NtrC family response regulator
VTPVGGRAGRFVDVRVLAATNRDLQAEVAAGRFRADLYHRLNVVRLEIPPLRARPDDILHLAHHFRERYSLLHGRGPFSFSAEAEALLVRHPWPGNVRELENRVMRAVILCQGTSLTPSDLGLGEETARRPEAAPPRGGGRAADPLAALRAELGSQIERALAGTQPLPPLGRWLVDDLVLEADAAAGSVGSRAAAILGMPETTLRRRLERARAHAQAGWSQRSASWPGVRACLADLARGGAAGDGRLFRQARQALLEEVIARTQGDERAGAALCGVTLPTFRRRGTAAGSGEPD